MTQRTVTDIRFAITVAAIAAVPVVASVVMALRSLR